MEAGRMPAKTGLLATRLLLLKTVARATAEYSPRKRSCSRTQPRESALSHLQHAPRELLHRQVQALGVDALPVQLHPSLRDQAARLAARDLEDAGDQGGQMHTPVIGAQAARQAQGDLRNVVRHTA